MAQYAEGASEIDPDAVATTEFTHVFRGYSIDEVKHFCNTSVGKCVA